MNDSQSGAFSLNDQESGGDTDGGDQQPGQDDQQPCKANLPPHRPPAQGLYDPQFEHDACGIGFVAHLKGQKSHTIVQQALTILANLNHRGASGAEANTGDGAGILLQLPHAFFQKTTPQENILLPQAGFYGVGMVFLPPDGEQQAACQEAFEHIVLEEGQSVLGWRTVPTVNHDLGHSAKASEPLMRQIFIGRATGLTDEMAFERKLYVIRKRAEREIRYGGVLGGNLFYIASLSHRTLVYKGMLTAVQLAGYFPDLQDPAMTSALAMVHSRFSTNTFPSWDRAHPNRMLMHNGEINTLRGNVNWMKARQAQLASDLWGDDLPKLLPIINSDGSDSGMFDNCLEFLTLSGRSLPHAIMMMVPEPWSKHEQMSRIKRAFYEYHACLMEPWDGPAAMGFTDGVQIGAILDRNGLRPSRYILTNDDLVVLASEVGVLDIPAENVLQKGRLEPGRMFLVDTAVGRILSDNEIKHQIATAQPYHHWLEENIVSLNSLPRPKWASKWGETHQLVNIVQQQHAFGYSFEDLRLLLAPMAKTGAEAIGSMGDDTPLAVLSHKSQPLYNYFKQLFAQVTNPPIDAIREELVTGTETLLGAEGNLLEATPQTCRRIALDHPILTNEQLTKLRHITAEGFQTAVCPMLFPVDGGGEGLAQALDQLCQQAAEAVAQGANLLILSDRDISPQNAAIPALLAVSALHHTLIRTGQRTQTSLIVESGEPREVHHFAVLLGYGADAINPYLAYKTLGDIIQKQLISDITYADALKKYIKAVVKGVVKILSKMGISTIQSYRGAQIFEALGLNKALIDDYFSGTASRIGGLGLDGVAEEVRQRHSHAFPERPSNGHTLPAGGRYQWRKEGEHHLFNPTTIHRLQHAVRTGDYAAYKKYAADVNDHSFQISTLRGLLQFKASDPIPLEEVEPIEAIVRRFKTGAMSYGSISQEAHETLAIAMNRLGGKSNTGEGGEDTARYTPDLSGDSRSSAIKQVASGRFGVTSEYLINAEELQIKMAQGAKPGEGGQLPGAKVYPWIAKVRHATPGVGLISPPPHHDIYSIEDLAQLIHDLKNANPRARINVKLVSEVGVGTIAAGVAKGHADVILISGHDGGTGASPQTSIKHAGLPWELGLAETHQTLILNNLRSRVVLETDGQLKTGRDVVIAALLGAEEFGFATAPLVAMGCIMMRVCQLDTCPVGIATQNPELRTKFAGDPVHVMNFMRFIAQEMREIMAQLGFRTVAEMVGRTDKLAQNHAIENWKTQGLDLSALLYQPKVSPEVGRSYQTPQNHGLDKALDRRVLLDLCRPALETGASVEASLAIRNIDRVVGTMVGSEITRRYGAMGLPEDTIRLHFQGSAGQSFGAFIPRGLTLILEGDANDYVGKGLSGGKIVIAPPQNGRFAPEENVIMGNVALYGATAGHVYIAGLAGERFAVRNSGANAVVEGVGDHGCEYMTGGRVVVLGRTGRNFAAGMSGGVAYVLDEEGDFYRRCNQEMVYLESLTDEREAEEVKRLIWQYAWHTGSRHGWQVWGRWSKMQAKFVRVMPKDYQRVLHGLSVAEQSGLQGDAALRVVFEASKQEPVRVGGI